MSDEPLTPAEAVKLMRARGINDPETLLGYAEPDAIARTCRWWDSLTGVGPGLLVSRIRTGGVDQDAGQPETEDKATALARRFAELVEGFPIGSIAEPHARLQDRRWPGEADRCGGQLVVYDATYPNLEAECDTCGFLAAYPLRALAGLPKPREPFGSVGLATPGTGRPLLGSGRSPRRLNPLGSLDPPRATEPSASDQARLAG